MHEKVALNIKRYNRYAHEYDAVHPEIFNDVEQHRLATFVSDAVDEIRSGGTKALDFGCGSGNLTRHLLAAGLDVTASDVATAFLKIVGERYGVATLELPGGSIDVIPDDSLDLIAMYSVAHHIPDYVEVISALVAKLKVGGVLVVEHERHEAHYYPTPALAQYREENHEATRGGLWDPEHKRWQFLLRAASSPKRHLDRWRRSRGRDREGDIHVHEWDHIEWPKLITGLEAAGATVVLRSDHLLFDATDDHATWNRWKDRCADQVALAVRRER